LEQQAAQQLHFLVETQTAHSRLRAVVAGELPGAGAVSGTEVALGFLQTNRVLLSVCVSMRLLKHVANAYHTVFERHYTTGSRTVRNSYLDLKQTCVSYGRLSDSAKGE